MEAGHQAGLTADDRGFRPRLVAAAALGGLITLCGATVAGWTLTFGQRIGLPPFAAALYREWLAGGGWLRLPLWGAACAALATLPFAARSSDRALALGAVLGLIAVSLLVRTAGFAEPETMPLGARARSRAVLRWSYHTPATVARIVEVSRDPNPATRELAVVALGSNLVVSDIEHATVTRPSRLAASPVRALLRQRLEECLHDPVESIRAQAARALWDAPSTFGAHPEAADTLAAILDRAQDSARAERLVWIALDAAAGPPSLALARAARRFARATPDTQLARLARLATGEAR